MDNLERIEVATDKVTDFQKKYNINSKRAANFIGKNLTLLICLLVPVLLVGFIWTDVGMPVISTNLFAEGVLTIVLLFTGETMMCMLGEDGGRLDTDYLEAKAEFDGLVAKVADIGTLLMGVFCDWQIDVELEQAVNTRLRMLRMTPQMWEEAKELSPEELKEKYGKHKANKLMQIANLKPIELNEAILLYNGKYTARGDVPESADDFLSDRKSLITNIVTIVFTSLLSISVAVTLTSDITIARVIYTVFKLAILLYRMCKGYARGAKAYNTIEVRRLKAVCNYLRQYIKFVEEKLYLKLDDRYGDISKFVAEDIEYVEYAEDESQASTIGFVG